MGRSNEAAGPLTPRSREHRAGNYEERKIHRGRFANADGATR
jgi:hypothetical protein